MLIKIAERLRPFTHLPGSYLILPGSTLRLRVCPTNVMIDDLAGATPRQIAALSWQVGGPLADFTVQQDLEKGCVVVWGTGKQGFVRYRLHAPNGSQGMVCSVEKGELTPSVVGEWAVTQTIDKKFWIGPKGIENIDVYTTPSLDRLSLGNHKGQDWILMYRRSDMAEIFPLWYRLGQLVPAPSQRVTKEGGSLLDQCRDAIAHAPVDQLVPRFRNLFLAGFEIGGLSPRLVDTDYQGIDKIASFDESPLDLLTQGTALIRSLFLQEKDQTITLLPALPSQFHCGRFIDVICEKQGKLSIEWTKKAIRQLSFCAQQNQERVFIFPQGTTTCRLRSSHKDRGTKYTSGKPLAITANQSYWFDNFQG